MYYFKENKIPKTSSFTRLIFYSPIHKLDPSSAFRQNISKLFTRNSIRNKTNINLTPRKFPKMENNLLSIQDILKITAYQKEKENEKKRQKILYKNINKYAKKLLSNYYIMIISNILSDKPNKLKSQFIEVLNVIESKELLTNYYFRKESKIKLAYLTKLFAKNTRIYPNYIKNEKIYNIMSNYLIEKEKLIIRIENNRKNILNIESLKYLNKNKNNKREMIKEEIDSFSDSENINLGDNLNNLNDSKSYSSLDNKSDSINKVQNIINDISLLLKNNNNTINTIENDKFKINKNIIKNNININLNLNTLKLNLNKENENKYLEKYKYKDDKDEDNMIKKTKTENNRNRLSLNNNKLIKNIIFSNLFPSKPKMVRFSFSHKEKEKEKDNIKEENKNNNRTFKYLGYNMERKTKSNIKLQTIASQPKYTLSLFADKNLYLNAKKKNFNSISDVHPVNHEKKYKHKNFKSTDIFLFNISQNEKNQQKSNIKNAIINVVKRYGISKYNSLNLNPKIKIKNINKICLTSSNNSNNKKKNYFLKEEIIPDINNRIKNKKNLGMIQSKHSCDKFTFFKKPELLKKRELLYLNKKNKNNGIKENNLLLQALSERIVFNNNKFTKNKNN